MVGPCINIRAGRGIAKRHVSRRTRFATYHKPGIPGSTPASFQDHVPFRGVEVAAAPDRDSRPPREAQWELELTAFTKGDTQMGPTQNQTTHTTTRVFCRTLQQLN